MNKKKNRAQEEDGLGKQPTTVACWAQSRPKLPQHWRLMPNARLYIISQARHRPFLDQPEAFNNALIEFLKPEALEVNI